MLPFDPECCACCRWTGWGGNFCCYGCLYCAPESVKNYSRVLNGEMVGGGDVIIINQQSPVVNQGPLLTNNPGGYWFEKSIILIFLTIEALASLSYKICRLKNQKILKKIIFNISNSLLSSFNLNGLKFCYKSRILVCSYCHHFFLKTSEKRHQETLHSMKNIPFIQNIQFFMRITSINFEDLIY